jgi:large subunit ribosomal protein L14
MVMCVDNSGVGRARLIQVLRCQKKSRKAGYGDKILVVIKSYNKLVMKNKNEKQKYKFRKGTIHKAVVVHLKKKIKRVDSTYFFFSQNSIVMTDKKGRPLARRIKAPIPVEIANKYPTIASICKTIV